MKWFKLIFSFFLIVFMIITVNYAFAEGEFCLEAGSAGAQQGITLDGDNLKFDLSGLRPGSLYSVWLISGSGKDMKMLGAGQVPYAFVVDNSGKASYSANVGAILKDWEIVKIVRHKDGNTSNMDVSNLEEVLTVDVADITAFNLLNK